MNAPTAFRGLRGLLGPAFESRSHVFDYQSRGLRALIRHAWKHVPFYRSRFEQAGIHPDEIRDVEDLRRLPVIERLDLQRCSASEICANGWLHRTNIQRTTSGSSGAPLVVRRCRSEERLMLAYRLRAMREWGFQPLQRRARFDHFGPEALDTELRPGLHEKLGLLRRLNLDWRMQPAELVQRLSHFGPDQLHGPPSLLTRLVDQLDSSELERIRPTRIVTGSEQLRSLQRTRIENGFACPVIDVYGCTELVFIAMQSPGRPGYRVCEEALIVEVLDENLRPSTRGEIYLTGLLQWSMPFIRYRLGDVVTIDRTEEPYLRLRAIDGRVNDRFQLPDGQELHGYSLGEIVENCGAPVWQFQIVQSRRDHFLFRLLGDGLNRTVRTKIADDARRLLGQEVEVRVETVDRFPRSEHKFRTFIPLERYRTPDDRESTTVRPTIGDA